jgi:hypothetical protein
VTTTNPVRFPDTSSQPLMTRRAWLLVLVNFLAPGSAQVLAGDRRLGRFGLRTTFLLWFAVIVLAVLYFAWQPVFYTILSTTITLWAVAAVLAFYAIVWVILTLNTLRLARIVKARPAARGWIAGLTTVLMIVISGTAAYGAYIATTASAFLSDVFITAPPEPPIDGRYNIMLLGGDAGPDREGLRPDSITVVSIDAETGAATMIGIPRNMEYVPFSPGPLADKYPDGYGADGGCEVDVCLLN